MTSNVAYNKLPAITLKHGAFNKLLQNLNPKNLKELREYHTSGVSAQCEMPFKRSDILEGYIQSNNIPYVLRLRFTK